MLECFLTYSTTAWVTWLISTFGSLLIGIIDELRDEKYIKMVNFPYNALGILGSIDSFEEQ